MVSSKDSLSIGLLWHSLRSNNLGNGALTLSHIGMLKHAARAAGRPISIHLFDAGGPLWYRPENTDLDEMVIDPYDHILPGTQLWRAVSHCDVVFDIGNGDLFSDIYGAEYFFLVSCHRIAALAQRVPLVLSPQTIGPFKREDLKSIARQLSIRCEKIFARDAESLSLLEEMGVTGAEQSVDVAFRLPFVRPSVVRGSTVRFGLNVSGLLYNDASSQRFAFGLKADYPTLIRTLISRLQKRSDLSLILVPHVVGDGEIDDVWICTQLSKEFGLQLAPQFKSPIEAKSFIAGLHVLAASRMHATIAAVSSGVPVIPIAYSRKFSGVLRSVEYPLLCDLACDNVDDIVDSVEHALERVEELRAAASSSNAIAQSKLDRYQSYLNELLSAPPSRAA